MTTTLLQQTPATSTGAATAMAWSNEKLRLACIDNIGLKQLWKLIALDSGNKANVSQRIGDNLQQRQLSHKSNNNNNNNGSNHNGHNNNSEINNNNNGGHDSTILPSSQMSLLKFLAINALELSAPASPALLQQKNTDNTKQSGAINCSQQPPTGWMQLSGHPESIVPTASGIVRKHVLDHMDNEVLAYQKIGNEPTTVAIVPRYYGTVQLNGELFVELQDLLAGFTDPCVIDIKMGCRTFLEAEVSNKTLRPDLYKKMITIDAMAPTELEHQQQAVTKLRYMLFREALSSSQTKGFRIEAMRLRGRSPVKDLKTVHNSEQIEQTIAQFVGGKDTVTRALIKRLQYMRNVIEKSAFFERHEIIGSSIFIVYDEQNVGAWLIDFAKSRQVPAGITVNHRSEWIPGNHEEGLLTGMDQLIAAFNSVLPPNAEKTTTIACKPQN